MKPCEIDLGFGHQRDESSNEVQQREDDVCGAIAVRRFELVAHMAIAARVPQVFDISAQLFGRTRAGMEKNA